MGKLKIYLHLLKFFRSNHSKNQQQQTRHQNGRRKRREGQEAFRPEMRSMPHCGGRRQTQDRPQSLEILGQEDGPSSRVLLLRGQHEKRSDLERGNARGLSDQPQEVHPWNQDGFSRSEKKERKRRFDCLPRRFHSINRRVKRQKSFKKQKTFKRKKTFKRRAFVQIYMQTGLKKKNERA